MKIGITGGIGSGKTIVCKVFELLGVPVFYADTVAKQLMQTDALLVEDIKAGFGAESYFTDGVLNRKYLAAKVFRDEKELEKLNSLVHPAVFRAFDAWATAQHTSYVIKEAALLFESGSYQDCNYSILVEAPAALRISRVMKRDKLSELEVIDRMKRQLSDEQKKKFSNFVLTNDEKSFLIPEILSLHRRFTAEGDPDDKP